MRRSRGDLQRAHYRLVKSMGLSAQPALHVIRKVADAYTTRSANLNAGNYGPRCGTRYKRVETTPIRFRATAAHAYDDRCLSWQMDAHTVSIWTVNGRVKGIAFSGSATHLDMLRRYRHGESDLVYRDGSWYLYATCEISESERREPNSWMGVDLGLANVATTSTGYRVRGRGLRRHRERQRRLRGKLQSKGTKSSKRLLKRRRWKDARYANDLNHQISKRIVVEAERTGNGIGLEDLTGIRERVRLRKPQRTALHSWGFRQLARFIQYKARRAGIPVVFVDARDTSRTCHRCGFADKKNRLNQSEFCCRSCGFVEHADVNASRNIAARAAAVWERGAQSTVPDPI